jgi:hypothetical protein
LLGKSAPLRHVEADALQSIADALAQVRHPLAFVLGEGPLSRSERQCDRAAALQLLVGQWRIAAEY